MWNWCLKELDKKKNSGSSPLLFIYLFFLSQICCEQPFNLNFYLLTAPDVNFHKMSMGKKRGGQGVAMLIIRRQMREIDVK